MSDVNVVALGSDIGRAVGSPCKSLEWALCRKRSLSLVPRTAGCGSNVQRSHPASARFRPLGGFGCLLRSERVVLRALQACLLPIPLLWLEPVAHGV
jgi:hypothetical protein